MKSVAAAVLMIALVGCKQAQPQEITYNRYHVGLPDERVPRQHLSSLEDVKPITVIPPAADTSNFVEPVNNGDVSLVATLNWHGSDEEQRKKFSNGVLISRAIWGNGCYPGSRYFVDFTNHGKRTRYTWICNSARDLIKPTASYLGGSK